MPKAWIENWLMVDSNDEVTSTKYQVATDNRFNNIIEEAVSSNDPKQAYLWLNLNNRSIADNNIYVRGKVIGSSGKESNWKQLKEDKSKEIYMFKPIDDSYSNFYIKQERHYDRDGNLWLKNYYNPGDMVFYSRASTLDFDDDFIYDGRRNNITPYVHYTDDYVYRHDNYKIENSNLFIYAYWRYDQLLLSRIILNLPIIINKGNIELRLNKYPSYVDSSISIYDNNGVLLLIDIPSDSDAAIKNKKGDTIATYTKSDNLINIDIEHGYLFVNRKYITTDINLLSNSVNKITMSINHTTTRWNERDMLGIDRLRWYKEPFYFTGCLPKDINIYR